MASRGGAPADSDWEDVAGDTASVISLSSSDDDNEPVLVSADGLTTTLPERLRRTVSSQQQLPSLTSQSLSSRQSLVQPTAAEPVSEVPAPTSGADHGPWSVPTAITDAVDKPAAAPPAARGASDSSPTPGVVASKPPPTYYIPPEGEHMTPGQSLTMLQALRSLLEEVPMRGAAVVLASLTWASRPSSSSRRPEPVFSTHVGEGRDDDGDDDGDDDDEASGRWTGTPDAVSAQELCRTVSTPCRRLSVQAAELLSMLSVYDRAVQLAGPNGAQGRGPVDLPLDPGLGVWLHTLREHLVDLGLCVDDIEADNEDWRRSWHVYEKYGEELRRMSDQMHEFLPILRV